MKIQENFTHIGYNDDNFIVFNLGNGKKETVSFKNAKQRYSYFEFLSCMDIGVTIKERVDNLGLLCRIMFRGEELMVVWDYSMELMTPMELKKWRRWARLTHEELSELTGLVMGGMRLGVEDLILWERGESPIPSGLREIITEIMSVRCTLLGSPPEVVPEQPSL